MRFEELPKPIPVGDIEDLSGKHFGELIVLFRVPAPDGNRKIYWACFCSCGEYCIKRSDQLKNGTSTWCGYVDHNQNNLIGQQFGRLTVVKKTSEYKRNYGWKYICYCNCGNPDPVIVWDKNLSRTPSCGCLKHEKAFDITGQKFGELIAIEPTDMKRYKSIVWKCKCSCGNDFYASSDQLRKGHARSCGCSDDIKSFGEYNIKQILDNNNIRYEQQKTFDTCRFPDTNHLGWYDFYIYGNDWFLLEFDGPQHKEYTDCGWNNKEKFMKTHSHDLYKNQWAYNNHIPLKRIPYEKRDDITLDDIMSDKYLISPITHPECYPEPNSSYPYINEIEINNTDAAIDRHDLGGINYGKLVINNNYFTYTERW